MNFKPDNIDHGQLANPTRTHVQNDAHHASPNILAGHMADGLLGAVQRAFQAAQLEVDEMLKKNAVNPQRIRELQLALADFLKLLADAEAPFAVINRAVDEKTGELVVFSGQSQINQYGENHWTGTPNSWVATQRQIQRFIDVDPFAEVNWDELSVARYDDLGFQR